MGKPTKVPIRDRHTKLLENLPKHNYKIAPAAKEAGFTDKTSEKQGKKLLETAIEITKERALQRAITGKGESQATAMSVLGTLGVTRDFAVEQYMKIVSQDKDLSTKLKALVPLMKDIGIDVTGDNKQVTVPILNVVVKEKAQPSHIVEDPQPSVGE